MAVPRRIRPRPERPPHDEELQKWLGQRIKAVRNAVDMNQDDFAYVVGVQRSYIGLIENGKRDLRVSTLQRIASAFDLQVHELLDPDFVLDPAQLKGEQSG
ncbi:hypothetical protein DAETH_10040 [Deinococcus aetherius]|uniref:HTH cro/C1-type domain-containing protein n=1 Tax=Deinococcus aetherius TaxID=200252 RepID=A0ABM8ABN9_9DEIO|nr:helix-turn-helix transcriptional regulator [Deinococcus aetherius]BDP41035.1 hypothetical protein DAETH_10040 [Deinococcus aetherius]